MNDIQSHLKDLSEIRTMMERNTKFLSLSGLSGVSAGICALVGAIVAWWYLGKTFNYLDFQPPSESEFIRFFLLDAGLVFVSALGSAIFFSVRMAKKNDLPVWNKTAKRLLLDLGIPLLAGAIFSLIQMLNYSLIWVPATTLLFYGMALLNASRNTFPEIRLLALSEIVLGLLCAVWTDFGLLFWAIGFGVLHIVYGLALYLKYQR